MKAPRYVAISVGVLLAFTLFQGLAWPVRPEPGWQQSWWQLPALAGIGHVLCLPGMILVLLLENCGIFNNAILFCAAVFGLMAEIAVVSIVSYVVARRSFELHSDG
ncbi:MAG TPA: hypothetical protein VMH87_13665 [Pseudomonadales bacterium]|nr:hypothetical protein [Pseudomonadales bacterium]